LLVNINTVIVRVCTRVCVQVYSSLCTGTCWRRHTLYTLYNV